MLRAAFSTATQCNGLYERNFFSFREKKGKRDVKEKYSLKGNKKERKKWSHVGRYGRKRKRKKPKTVAGYASDAGWKLKTKRKKWTFFPFQCHFFLSFHFQRIKGLFRGTTLQCDPKVLQHCEFESHIGFTIILRASLIKFQSTHARKGTSVSQVSQLSPFNLLFEPFPIQLFSLFHFFSFFPLLIHVIWHLIV